MPDKWEEILHSQTPKRWLERAINSQEILLIDHAHCEKKAATTAISLIHRYPDKDLVRKLSPLAREELLHFEQVLRLIKKEGYSYRNLRPGAYARTLFEASSKQEPQRLKDALIICALIEARSCERFDALIPLLPISLSNFYSKLHEAEARHCDLYLDIYSEIFEEDYTERLDYLSAIESSYINQADKTFRFHSGY
ncbi:MAG: tRNA-(ms[2]io[6]A)-hydroxylase [Gammaproteobacteria bacterium]|nr:tRNA-(ms[2]io[6]A)-hydroxylase [Gammaproteobacteria bacterium]HJL96277.1 tRNA-(ms[2]io[6]A)-hydroxylase [SAR86 cluster bacterium]HJM58965.1 tRNA-(ms[2]io[6]A)-hydroxylase [SAR86 cluster bacterium]|tara:strand:- start:7339 stop:7926 length:588 start_codon:yes stop_codon:yes gene_type:complete